MALPPFLGNPVPRAKSKGTVLEQVEGMTRAATGSIHPRVSRAP